MLLQTDALSLFGSIPLRFSTCHFQIRQYTDLEGGLTLPERRALVKDSSYYPGGTEPALGALRCRGTLVPAGTRTALLALVGSGEARIAPLYEEGLPVLFIEGDESDIRNTVGSDGIGLFILCLLIGLPVTLILWLKARTL